MASVGTAYVSIRVDTKGFEKSLDTFLARLSSKMETAGSKLGGDLTRGLRKTDWNSGFSGLSAAADKASKDAVKSLDRVENGVIRLAGYADEAGDSMSSSFDNVGHSVDGVRASIVEASKEITGLKNEAGRVDLSFGGAGGGGGGGGLRKVANDASWLSSKLKELGDESERNVAKLNSLFRLAAFGGTALAGLVGGLSAAAQGLFAIGANAASALPALAALSTGMIGLGQVGATVGIAMQGVGDALKAGFKVATDTATPAAAAAKKLSTVSKDGIKAAQEAVQAARENLRAARLNRDGIIAAQEAVQDSVRGIVDAKDALQDAYRDAGWAASDAARRTIRAEQELAAAQGAVTDAQEALNAARAEAIEQLEDIGFKAEDAALAEERAELALEDAYARLLAVSELAPDNKTRQEAELAFKEAELNLRQAKDAREDADAAQADAAATGIEGTQAMLDAKADLASAQEDEAQAAQDLADAQREQTRTTIENAESIQDAEQGLADSRAEHRAALAGVIEAEQEHAEAVADAADALKDAQGNLRDARADYEAARAALAAQNAELAKTTPAFDAYAAALANLSPQQRIFVERLVGLRDAWIEARKEIADPLFEGLNDALTTMLQGDLLGVLKKGLTDTSTTLGVFAEDAAKAFNEKAFTSSLADVMDSNQTSIKNFGDAAINLADAFVQVADAASPLLEDFSKWVSKVTEGWSETSRLKNSTGELTDKFQTAADRVREFWNLGKELWRTLDILGESANRAANRFGDLGRKGEENKDKFGYITSLADSLKGFNDNLEKSDGKAAGFEQALKNLNAAGRALKNVVIDPLISMGQDPNIEKTFDKLGDTDAFDRLADAATTAGPALADIAINVADIVAALSESHAIDHFLDILKLVSGVIKTIVDNDFAAEILKWTGYLTGAYAAVKLLWGGLKLISAPVVKPVKFVAGLFKKDPKDETRAADAGEDTADAYARGLRAGLPKVEAAMEALEAKVKQGFNEIRKTLYDDAFKTGTHLMEGLEAGIREGTIEAKGAAFKAGRSVADDIGDGAGTHSPSTITFKDGLDVMEGIEQGINAGLAEAKLTATKAGASVGNSVGNSAKTAAATSSAGIGPAMGASATSSVGKSSGAMSGALGKMMKPLSGIARGFGGLMTLAMGPFGIAIELIILLLPILIPLFKKLEEKTGIFSKTLEGVQNALGWVWDKIQTVFNWVKDNWPLLLTIITGPIGLAVSQIIKHWDDIKAAVSTAIDFIKNLLTGMWDKITEGWDKIVTWASGLWASISDKFHNLIDKAAALLTKIWDAIKTGWNKLVAWSDILEDWVKTKIRDLIEKAKEKLGTIWEVIKDKWQGIKEWADGLWDSITGKISAFITNFWTGLGVIWDIIKTKWGDIKDWLDGLWGTISGKITNFVTSFSGAISGIWSGIQDGFVTAVEWVLGKVNTYLIGGINNILEKVGAGTIPTIPVNIGEPPKLAEGGPIRGPGGPKDDKVLIRASPGEYMLPAKSARSLGPAALEHMRKTGTLPMGDIGGLFSSVWHAVENVGDALANGAEYAVKWVLGNITSKLPDNIIGRLIAGILTWAADKFTGFGKKKDEEAAAAAGASVFVPDPSNPTGVGLWKGGLFTRRFVEHMKAAEKLAGVSILVIQGGFRPATSYSGTSHRGDALDTIVSNALIVALRRVGIAAGDRTGLGNWAPHVHAIPGPSAGLALGSAPGQWASYIAMGGAKQSLKSPWGLATGGTVRATPGGVMAMIAEGGRSERVTPLDREGFSAAERRMIELMEQRLGGAGGAGGDTYNIHPSAPIDEANLAAMVSRRVAWNRRRGARAG